MRHYKKSLWCVLALIGTVSVILSFVASDTSVMAQLVTDRKAGQGLVSVKADLVQDKVLRGSDGRVVVSVTMSAADMEPIEHRPVQHADLVIVLDRTGSMQGQKLTDARNAVIGLVDRLSPQDRLALVSYSNGVNAHFPLMYMDDANRQNAKSAVREIYSGGGTNLGGGLGQGIQTLMQTSGGGRQRKVILISDGLANHGVTDPNALGVMASGAVENNFAVSTLGVGYDFNEVLMTTIADHGAGQYYFLENPNAFVQVFEKEFEATRNVAASSMELRVPLKDGIKLIHAGGYPIAADGDAAVIHPGDLLSGQDRKLFLTFKVPTDKERNFDLGDVSVQFKSNGHSQRVSSGHGLHLACVSDKKAVIASIDQVAWENQVVREDYNQLKEEVASDIRKGNKDDAVARIQAYETRNRAVNDSVGSTKVSDNLKNDVQMLRQSVADTFAGTPAAVAEKKKQRSKALQYESYTIRRDKK